MGKRILIVDDSKTTLEVLKVYLMGRDYEFETAGGGSEALLAAQRQKPDLVISDLTMPGVTGLDLCRRLRETPALKAVPLIIITANKDVAVRRTAFAAGVDGFLTKPIDGDQLRALIARLISH